MKIFDIQNNHKAGIFSDLSGSVFSSKISKTINYPKGRCPVFGKVIENNERNFFLNQVEIDNLPDNTYLLDAESGNLTSLGSEPVSGIRFPKIKNKDELVSLIETDSILECAIHTKKFEHVIDNSSTNNNCLSKNNHGKCFNHPFIYNLDDKKCYVLYPLQQYKVTSETWPKQYLYRVAKNKNTENFVFGTAYIREDWMEACPVKVIKGAVFGKWEKNKCNPLNDTRLGKSYISADACGFFVFDTSTTDFINTSAHIKGRDWASYYESSGCELYTVTPDCLIYNYDGYSFTSVGMGSLEHYDLPPCIDASKNWTIKATCGNHIEQNYTCINYEWVGDNGVKILKCDSKDLWANSEVYGRKSNREKQSRPIEKVTTSQPSSSENLKMSYKIIFAIVTFFILQTFI